MKSIDKYELVNELARRRGFFWPSFEIYGGASGFISWGPFGSIMKRKIEDKFRRMFLQRHNFYEVETPIITPEKIFKASGHLEHFKEPMVECLKCKRRFRADHLLEGSTDLSQQEIEKMDLAAIEETIRNQGVKCPDCGGLLSEPQYFLTMFKTTIGPYSDAIGYGRPEAAQGIFSEFKRLYEQVRERLPIGFATIGHALRNEISPRQGPIRLREFTIIDLEFFIDPANPQCPCLEEVADEIMRLVLAKNRLEGCEDPVEVAVKEAINRGYIVMEWQAYFMALAKRFLSELGVPDDKQRFIEKLPWERAHYSAQGFDQEVYLDRWGWVEVAGFNYRTDYDLSGHMRESGVDMKVFKPEGTKTERTELIVKPIQSRIRLTFKDETPKVLELVSKADARKMGEDFRKQGFSQIDGFKILPEHVEIAEMRVQEHGRRFIPHVIEPSFGSDRLAYVALEYAYTQKRGRVILELPPDIAPVEVAVLPLVSKDGLPEKAKKIHLNLIEEGFIAEYDESGSIGKRYARFDEIGTPICVTIDYETLKNETVTLRDRDSWRQVRVDAGVLPSLLHKYLQRKVRFDDLGD
ncbi:MAG: glycine--tRNA ligase [Nitrososphaerota archaeon]|nr:glycine--tRNA ligase [Candidatus Bathyarchaeota archaeon]MDW8048256.1 glycine--tRNA ligase [Nitrososphaerota archaeon]